MSNKPDGLEKDLNHEFYMKKCISLAQLAKQRGDSPVGSILVLDDRIIAEGIEGGKTHGNITYHAEIEAIRAGTKLLQTQDLSDCIMYTTHEPCIMCSYVIRHCRIRTVVVGVTTGEIGGFSSNFPVLVDKTIKRWSNPPVIISGILKEECRSLQA